MKKVNRVRKDRDFKIAFTEGLTRKNANFVITYLPNTLGYVRIGISVSKKRGNAVRRNYIKRQIRAICRQHIDLTQSYDLIVIVRDGFNPTMFNEMKDSLIDLVNHLERSYHAKKDEKTT